MASTNPRSQIPTSAAAMGGARSRTSSSRAVDTYGTRSRSAHFTVLSVEQPAGRMRVPRVWRATADGGSRSRRHWPVGSRPGGCWRVACPSLCAAGRVAGFGCSVGASGTARKPLALLGLGLTAALRVRFVRAGGAGSRLVSHTIRPERDELCRPRDYADRPRRARGEARTSEPVAVALMATSATGRAGLVKTCVHCRTAIRVR
jgi:hypothetical protein